MSINKEIYFINCMMYNKGNKGNKGDDMDG